jgi:uncharacterized membrane protein
MQIIRSMTLTRLLVLVAGLLICKVTAAVVIGYRNYLPPNFDSDFLHGRESYFFGAYQWAFYTHIASGPVSLVLGMLLISERFRCRFPAWHRRLGRVQVVCVLLMVAPSGLWMARYTATGPIAGIGFAVLSILTATCVVVGWRNAVKTRFAEHRRWMWRCFLLLCSAVVLRVLGGTATVFGVQSEWFDPIASWASWLIPLSTYELCRLANRRRTHQRPNAAAHFEPSVVSIPSSD